MRLTTLLILLLISSYVCADAIVEVDLKVGDDGYTQVNEHVVYEQGTTGTIILPDNADELTLTDNSGPVEYATIDLGGLKALNITVPGYFDGVQSKEVSIKYGTTRLTRKEGDVWGLNFVTPANPRKTIVKISLPESYNVTSIQPHEILRTYVSDGIWLYPQAEDLQADGRFNLTLTYTYLKGQAAATNQSTIAYTTTIPQSTRIQNDNTTLSYMTFGLIIIILAGIGYIIYQRAFQRKPTDAMTVNVSQDVVGEPKVMDGKVSFDVDPTTQTKATKAVKESILKMLDDNELAIVKLLESSEEEEVTQAYIHKTTGIPKSSLSDVIKHIEKRNIIERRTDGRVKWIKLKSWVLE